MSRLQQILVDAKAGLHPWDPIPSAMWPRIAAQCGAAEIAEIHQRIAALQEELTTVGQWDGDTQDDVHRTIELFRAILTLTGSSAAPDS